MISKKQNSQKDDSDSVACDHPTRILLQENQEIDRATTTDHIKMLIPDHTDLLDGLLFADQTPPPRSTLPPLSKRARHQVYSTANLSKLIASGLYEIEQEEIVVYLCNDAYDETLESFIKNCAQNTTITDKLTGEQFKHIVKAASEAGVLDALSDSKIASHLI